MVVVGREQSATVADLLVFLLRTCYLGSRYALDLVYHSRIQYIALGRFPDPPEQRWVRTCHLGGRYALDLVEHSRIRYVAL